MKTHEDYLRKVSGTGHIREDVDFHRDLLTLKDRMVSDDKFAKDIYGALCNMRWQRKDDEKNIYSCSWRYAGGLVSDIRDKGEYYLDYYCSGNEGMVTEEVKKEFDKLGWKPLPWDN